MAKLGCYAWKPPIVRAVAEEVGPSSVVMWIDSGARLHQRLTQIVDATVRGHGFASDATALTVRELTHPRSIAYFGEHFNLDPEEPLRLKPGATYSKGHGAVKDGVPVGAQSSP